MSPKSSFDELLYQVETIDQLACDPEVGGCRKLNYTHYVLSAQPYVFTAGKLPVTFYLYLYISLFLVCAWMELNLVNWITTLLILDRMRCWIWYMALLFVVLGWQNACECVDDITATLAAFTTEIDISVLYHGLDQKCTHRLVFVVRISLFLCSFYFTYFAFAKLSKWGLYSCALEISSLKQSIDFNWKRRKKM